MPRRLRYTRERFLRERRFWALLTKNRADELARETGAIAKGARSVKVTVKVYGQNSDLESFTARWARAA